MTEDQLLTCPMCGGTFDPQANPACPSCPINSACSLACCPHCGYETVDPQRSQMVGLLRRLGGLLRPPVASQGSAAREG